MSETKKGCCGGKGIFILLLINTLLLGAILLKMYCLSSGSGICPLKKKAMCPISQGVKGTAMETKGSTLEK